MFLIDETYVALGHLSKKILTGARNDQALLLIKVPTISNKICITSLVERKLQVNVHELKQPAFLK